MPDTNADTSIHKRLLSTLRITLGPELSRISKSMSPLGDRLDILKGYDRAVSEGRIRVGPKKGGTSVKPDQLTTLTS